MKDKAKKAGVVVTDNRAFAVANSFRITLEGEVSAWLNEITREQIGYRQACKFGTPQNARAVFCKERARFAALLIEEALGALFASSRPPSFWQVCPRLEPMDTARPRRWERLEREEKGGVR